MQSGGPFYFYDVHKINAIKTVWYIYLINVLLLKETDIAVHFGNDVYFLDETYETGQHIKNDELKFSSVGC